MTDLRDAWRGVRPAPGLIDAVAYWLMNNAPDDGPQHDAREMRKRAAALCRYTDCGRIARVITSTGLPALALEVQLWAIAHASTPRPVNPKAMPGQLELFP